MALASKEDRIVFYWGPMRAAERASLKEIADGYNADGDMHDDVLLPGQHRHARFGGGFWS